MHLSLFPHNWKNLCFQFVFPTDSLCLHAFASRLVNWCVIHVLELHATGDVILKFLGKSEIALHYIDNKIDKIWASCNKSEQLKGATRSKCKRRTVPQIAKLNIQRKNRKVDPWCCFSLLVVEAKLQRNVAADSRRGAVALLYCSYILLIRFLFDLNTFHSHFFTNEPFRLRYKV